MNITDDIAVMTYKRLCRKAAKEVGSNLVLIPFVFAMSDKFQRAVPLPPIDSFRMLSGEDQSDVLLLVTYLATAPQISEEFEKQFGYVPEWRTKSRQTTT